MNIESKKITVNKSAAAMCSFLSDVENYEQLMPENCTKFEVIRENAFVFALKGMPEIALEIKNVNELEQVVLGAISDKLPFTLTGQIEPIDENRSQVQLLFQGEFNAMMGMMIKGPITKFLEALASNMESL